MEGNIFNIQRYSIHDGPGIRTTVFLKGCGLKCFWCHNPESLQKRPQLQLFLQKCIGCGKCFVICPVNAHRARDGNREFLRDLCVGCGKCADICYAEALILRGKTVPVQEVIDEVERDLPFYEKSGGGVTFSGGEPLYQKEFLESLLRESKKRGLHTAVETAGHVPWEHIEVMQPFVDLWLYDLKVMDSAKHKEVTGAGNTRILENLKALAALENEITIRIPVIPGVNDNSAEMEKMAAFISGLRSVHSVDLLPFHQMAEGKYESLGMPYKAGGMVAPSNESLLGFQRIFENLGITAKIM